ncbi:MAG: hypothetical protein LBH80_07700 [Prevotellaceae bacterium]|nr:hypothetical protein [Prevotellaceae bacterium]
MLHKVNAQPLQKFISFSHRTFFDSNFTHTLAAHLQAAQNPRTILATKDFGRKNIIPKFDTIDTAILSKVEH